MRPKTIFILVIYMLLVYTTFYVFVNDSFAVGGNQEDLIESGSSSDSFATLVSLSTSANTSATSWATDFATLNSTYGDYQGKEWRFNWFDSGEYRVWLDIYTGQETIIPEWKFQKFMDGTLSFSDISFQEMIGKFFTSIYDAIGYVFGLITFTVDEGATLSDGSSIPSWLQWIPLLMVLPVWIAVIYWLFPYIIKLLHAVAELIPL